LFGFPKGVAVPPDGGDVYFLTCSTPDQTGTVAVTHQHLDDNYWPTGAQTTYTVASNFIAYNFGATSDDSDGRYVGNSIVATNAGVYVATVSGTTPPFTGTVTSWKRTAATGALTADTTKTMSCAGGVCVGGTTEFFRDDRPIVLHAPLPRGQVTPTKLVAAWGQVANIWDLGADGSLTGTATEYVVDPAGTESDAFFISATSHPADANKVIIVGDARISIKAFSVLTIGTGFGGWKFVSSAFTTAFGEPLAVFHNLAGSKMFMACTRALVRYDTLDSTDLVPSVPGTVDASFFAVDDIEANFTRIAFVDEHRARALLLKGGDSNVMYEAAFDGSAFSDMTAANEVPNPIYFDIANGTYRAIGAQANGTQTATLMTALRDPAMLSIELVRPASGDELTQLYFRPNEALTLVVADIGGRNYTLGPGPWSADTDYAIMINPCAMTNNSGLTIGPPLQPDGGSVRLYAVASGGAAVTSNTSTGVTVSRTCVFIQTDALTYSNLTINVTLGGASGDCALNFSDVASYTLGALPEGTTTFLFNPKGPQDNGGVSFTPDTGLPASGVGVPYDLYLICSGPYAAETAVQASMIWQLTLVPDLVSPAGSTELGQNFTVEYAFHEPMAWAVLAWGATNWTLSGARLATGTHGFDVNSLDPGATSGVAGAALTHNTFYDLTLVAASAAGYAATYETHTNILVDVETHAAIFMLPDPLSLTVFTSSSSLPSLQINFTEPAGMTESKVVLQRQGADDAFNMTLNPALAHATSFNFHPNGLATSSVLTGFEPSARLGTVMEEGNWTMWATYRDAAGNAHAYSAPIYFLVDRITLRPSLDAPVAGAFNQVHLDYSLPEAATNGTIFVEFVSTSLPGSPSWTLTMANQQEVDQTFVPTAAVLHSLVGTLLISWSSSEGLVDMQDGTFTVTVKYQDAYANPENSSSVAGFVFDSTTETPTLSDPEAGGVASATTTNDKYFVSVTIPETPLSGSVRLNWTNLVTNDTVSWVLNITSSGSHSSVTVPRDNPANDGLVTSGDTVPGGTYNVTLEYQDALENPRALATSASYIVDFVSEAPILYAATNSSVASVADKLVRVHPRYYLRETLSDLDDALTVVLYYDGTVVLAANVTEPGALVPLRIWEHTVYIDMPLGFVRPAYYVLELRVKDAYRNPMNATHEYAFARQTVYVDEVWSITPVNITTIGGTSGDEFGLTFYAIVASCGVVSIGAVVLAALAYTKMRTAKQRARRTGRQKVPETNPEEALPDDSELRALLDKGIRT